MNKFRKLYKYLLTLPVAMLVLFGLFNNVMAASTVYTVKPGDTLCGIGKQFNVPCKDMVANFPGKNPNLIHPGDKFEFGRADGLLGGLVSKPYTFSPNTVISSAQINANYDTLYTLVNGNLSNTNINASAAISSTKINGTAIVSTGATSQSIYSTTTIYGGLIVSSTSNYFRVPVMTLAQRDALTGLEGGIIIYVSDSGQFFIREGGSWAAISPAAETATANSTTKGIVEEATNAEFEAGTAVGSTGARLYVNPSSALEYLDTHFSNNLSVGENVSAFNVLYISSTGKYMIAHGNVQSEVDKITGVSFETVTATNYPRVYFPGSIIYSTAGMTTGSPVYLSDTGTPSTTAGTIRKVLGLALGTNVWQFNPLIEQTNSNPASSTANIIPLTNASSTLQGWSGAFGGDGSDGALNVTSGTTTISLASTNIVVKQYTSINISAGAVLTFSNPPVDGSLIVLKSRTSCNIAGTINAKGMGAATSTRAFGLLEATQAYNAAVTNTYLYANATYKLWAGMQALAMGSGGQAASTASTSGRGGANLRIECAGAVSFTGTINVNGEAGLAGVAGSTSGPGTGGGAGGGGGSFEGFANRITANSGSVTFAGGTGGRGGDGACTTNAATDGNGGAGGTGGGAFLGAGGAAGAGETGGGGSIYANCTPGTGGAGGATNGAAGAAGAGGSHGGGAGTFYHGGAGGGGGAGHGGFSLGWVQNYWFN